MTAIEPALHAGDTRKLCYAVQNSDGTALDLTGSTIKWAAAQITQGKIGSPDLEKSVGDGITVTNSSGGLLDVVIAKGDLQSPGVFHIELEVTKASGESYTTANTLCVKQTVYQS